MAERSISLSVCPVCFCDDTKLWSVGECRHPICYVCSTRLRVLCEKKDCPVCRESMDKVIFCGDPLMYEKLKGKNLHVARKSQVYFEDKLAKDLYYSIQHFVCVVCDDNSPFYTLNKLKDHLRQKHEVQFCPICLTHLDLFPCERKVYTRSQLTQHRRVGDSDGACKGHPLCEFCDDRFLDKEHLYLHLKKNHFWCHFCENDGLFEFFVDYKSLKRHFQSSHFICQLGDCQKEQYTNAFRSRVDLQAHKAKIHAKEVKKSEAVHVQQDDLGFKYQRPKTKKNSGSNADKPASSRREEEEMFQLAQALSLADQTEVDKQRPPEVDMSVPQNWPSLSVLMGIEDPSDALKSEHSIPLYSSQVTNSKTGAKCPPPGFQTSISDKHTTLGKSLPLASEPNPPTSTSISSLEEATTASSYELQQAKSPPGFTDALKKSNADLKKKINFYLNNNSKKIKYFKSVTSYFRQGKISADDFYAECKDLFGEKWLEIFEDFVASFPDPSKRAELKQVHLTMEAPTWVSSGKKRQGYHVKPAKSNQNVSQWKVPNTQNPNQRAILDEEDYPSLTSSSSKQPAYSTLNSTWSSRMPLRSKT